MRFLLFVVLLASVAAFGPAGIRSRHFQVRGTSLQMNLFDRFARVVKSNVNQVISNMEDPEKVLDQAVADMQNDLVKIRQSYAEIFATQKRSQKQKADADAAAADWYKRAQLALEKEDEELAKEALSRRQIQVEVADGLAATIEKQAVAIDKLYTSMTALDNKITDAKRQKDAMVARARTAKANTQVTDLLNAVGDNNSMEAFDRMKAKVETMEAKAEIAGELAASSSGTTANLEDRFKALESGNAVDDELEKMKAMKALPGSSAEADEPKELPAEVDLSELDQEYEKLKKELGK
jgi:phage shock protein A